MSFLRRPSRSRLAGVYLSKLQPADQQRLRASIRKLNHLCCRIMLDTISLCELLITANSDRCVFFFFDENQICLKAAAAEKTINVMKSCRYLDLICSSRTSGLY